MNTSKNWDVLSNHFNVHLSQVDKGVAANLEQVWPTLEPIVGELPPGAAVLDYGCGTGPLCNKLYSLGFKVSGTDISPEMIKIARENSPVEIDYWCTDEDSLCLKGEFALITSSMVFQFVTDLPALLLQLKNRLSPGGVLWFSVHNEAYVTHASNSHTRFENYSEEDGRGTATLILGDTQILTHVRSAKDYEILCATAGLKKESEWHSKPYSDGTPPKYLIQSYRSIER